MKATWSRIALCVAAWARERVHAVAAGGAHPFAQAGWIDRDPANGRVESRVRRLDDETYPPTAEYRPVPDNVDAVTDAMGRSWPDIADAVARSGVLVLLFVGKEDPRCSVVLSFAEQAGAMVIVLPKHDHATTAAATGNTELLSLILQFFQSPTSGGGRSHFRRICGREHGFSLSHAQSGVTLTYEVSNSLRRSDR